MASTAKHGNKKLREPTPMRKAKCLKAMLNGKVIFRVTNCRTERVKVRRRPSRFWTDSGWFADDLLDE